MKKFLFGLTVFALSAVSNAGHHENAFPFKYFLHNDVFTTQAPDVIEATEKFIESGVLNERGVAMGLYSFNAVGRHGASHAMIFNYPNAESLPSPTLLNSGKEHIAFSRAMRKAGNVTIQSTLYKAVKEFVPADAGGKYKVFSNYFLSISDPDTYIETWVGLMKELKVTEAFGVREVVAGDTDGVTHMLWIGFETMTDLVNGMETMYSSPKTAAALTKFADIREIKRTAIATTAIENVTALME